MKRVFLAIMASYLMISGAVAKETITINSYAGHGGNINNLYRLIIDQANTDQDRYFFTLVPKPGAQGLLALQDMDQKPTERLAMISAGFVDLYLSDKIKRDDYVPVNSAGNTCWVVISNKGNTQQGAKSLQGQKEILIGTVAKGSSAHFTALVLGERMGFKTEPVMFKTNTDALMLMSADGSINMVVESPANYLNWQERKIPLHGLGINCPVRNPKLPEMRTLKEQGFDVPSIWAFVVSNRAMPDSKRKDMAFILDQAMRKIGQEQIFQKFDYQVPIFHGQTTEQHYLQSLTQIEQFRKRFAKEVN